MIKRTYYYGRPKRKGDAICADFSLRWHGREMVSIEIHADIVRVSNIRPHRKNAVFDLLDAVKEIAENNGCRLITYYGELDDVRGEILKEYGFEESSYVLGGRWFRLALS